MRSTCFCFVRRLIVGGVVGIFMAGVALAQATITLPDITAGPSTSAILSISYTQTSATDAVAAELRVSYDNSVVTPTSPTATDLSSTLTAGWAIQENTFPGGGNIDTLALALSTGVDTIDAGGTLLKLLFDVAPSRIPASTAFTFEQMVLNDGTPTVTTFNGSLTVVGTTGTITANPDPIIPGQTLAVTVTDADEDLDVGTPNAVSIVATSTVSSDTENISLLETGPSSGVFSGSLTTVFGTVAVPFDGVMTIGAGDSIFVSYTDSLDATGVTATRKDSVAILVGTDGVLTTSVVVQSKDGRFSVRDTVRIRVEDSDGDLDVGSPDQVSVTTTNLVSGELEVFTLQETGNSTGVFQVKVPTVEGASGTNFDNIFSIDSSHSIQATYEDGLSSTGGAATRLDTTFMVNLFGDVQNNDKVQAFDAAFIIATAVGLTSSSANDSLKMDVDGDNEVLAIDASLVLQYVVRLINRFPVQTDTTMSGGDDKNHPFLKPVPMDQLVALGSPVIQDDGSVVVAIDLADRDQVVAGTFELGLGEGVTVVDVLPGSGYDGFMTVHNVEEDRVRIAFAGSESDLMGRGSVVEVHVKADQDFPVRLYLDRATLNGFRLSASVSPETIDIETAAESFEFALDQNVPNPFNPQTTIRYSLAEPADVRMVVYSLTGQEVQVLVSERLGAGPQRIVWDGKDALGRQVGSGVYLVRLIAGPFQSTRKVLLLR